MNVVELENILKSKNINVSNRDICRIWGMDEASYSRKKKNGSEVKQKNIEQIEEYYGVRLRSELPNNLLQLDFYPNVFGSCGNGSMVFDESSEKMSVTKDQISNYSQCGKYSVISARGSSMSPTVCDEDLLIIQHELNENIIDNTIYLFKYNDELFIKRLVKNIDQIICISENPRFEDRVIIPKNNNFVIVGKVVGLIRKKV